MATIALPKSPVQGIDQSTFLIFSLVAMISLYLLAKGKLPTYLSFFGFGGDSASGGGTGGGSTTPSITSGAKALASSASGAASGALSALYNAIANPNNSTPFADAFDAANGTSYGQEIQNAAAGGNVPANVADAQFNVESGFNAFAQNATSSAKGLAQFIDSTASNVPGYGSVDANDPYASIDAGIAYDNYLYQKQGSVTGALQRYGTLPGYY